MMNKKFLSGAVLKWIAMITMLIDHFACSFYMASYSCGRPIFSYDLYLILRAIGRAAFPIYCFLLVEGFLHTRNVHKYLFRLLCFGIVSEVPFDMAAEGSELSQMAVSFSINNTVMKVISKNGSEKEYTPEDVLLGHGYSTERFLKIQFMQSGLKLKNIRFKKDTNNIYA